MRHTGAMMGPMDHLFGDMSNLTDNQLRVLRKLALMAESQYDHVVGVLAESDPAASVLACRRGEEAGQIWTNAVREVKRRKGVDI